MSSKIKADVEKKWKKKIKDMTHKHLITIEELKEQHKLALESNIFKTSFSNDIPLNFAISGTRDKLVIPGCVLSSNK